MRPRTPIFVAISTSSFIWINKIFWKKRSNSQKLFWWPIWWAIWYGPYHKFTRFNSFFFNRGLTFETSDSDFCDLLWNKSKFWLQINRFSPNSLGETSWFNLKKSNFGVFDQAWKVLHSTSRDRNQLSRKISSRRKLCYDRG